MGAETGLLGWWVAGDGWAVGDGGAGVTGWWHGLGGGLRRGGGDGLVA
jgi:hypothetical protein